MKIADIQFLIIDLFCGAGGTTLGFDLAVHPVTKGKIAEVIACINHDPLAIKSHHANNPRVYHFEEDITKMYGLIDHGVFLKSADFVRLLRIIDIYRACYPNAKVILWASLECTNFSKAKGGLPRDADSRTLAEHLEPYIVAIQPDYIQIENVVEFMAWGPLDEKGKPISRKNGKDWLRWRESVCRLGYYDEWREINSADFGALTSRNRLFGCFAKHGLPIVWPAPTHAKNPEKTSMLQPLRKWEPVKKALDFSDEGLSVFNRKKPLSSKTFQRLYMGCIKHIAGGKKAFIAKWNSTNNGASVEDPCPVITTQNRLGLATASFIDQRNGTNPAGRSSSIDDPAKTVTATGGNQQLVQATFITKAFSSHSGKNVNSGSSVDNPCPTVAAQNRLGVAFITKAYRGNVEHQSKSIEEPAGTLTTRPTQQSIVFISRYNGVNGGKHDNSRSSEEPVGALGTGDNHAKICATFIQKYYSNGGQHNSIEEPAASITTKDRLSKVTANFIDLQYSNGKREQSIEDPLSPITTIPKANLVHAEWLMSTHFNNIGSSIDDPAPTITADGHAHYIINPSWGGNSGSIDEPCHVVVARQDKAPLGLITCVGGVIAVPVYEEDCEWCIRLKEFMVLYGIADIKMRMLKVPELKLIQGFPENYILLGNQTDQKKFIGNSVHPIVPKSWAEAMSLKLYPETYLKAA